MIKDRQNKFHSETNGRYIRKDGSTDAETARLKELTKPENSATMRTKNNGKFGGATHDNYLPALQEAKKTCLPEDAWRVSDYEGNIEAFKEAHPEANLHITDGGSTIAVDNGDIIAVCKNDNDTVKGYELLEMAVANGGNKLDSYAGNHIFYTRNGFEPVSWCEFNEEYAPHDWKKNTEGYEKEPIIFYRYTGKNCSEKWQDFCTRVPASKDYDEAMQIRDNSMEESEENGRK